MDDPDQSLTPELAARLLAAWIDPADYELDPDVYPADFVAERRLGTLGRLREVETVQGPPTAATMVGRLEFEADHDAAMPSWIRRPWFVPADRMLAMDEHLCSVLGVGHSSSTSSGRSERMLRVPEAKRDYGLLVYPVPGAIPPGTDRRALETELSARCTEILGMACRIHVWNDSEPAKAFQGLMEGRIVREGHKELGIPREHRDWSDDEFF